MPSHGSATLSFPSETSIVGIRQVLLDNYCYNSLGPDKEDILLTWNGYGMRAQNKPLLSSAGESLRMFVTVV